jgi:hypothetical protein
MDRIVSSFSIFLIFFANCIVMARLKSVFDTTGHQQDEDPTNGVEKTTISPVETMADRISVIPAFESSTKVISGNDFDNFIYDPVTQLVSLPRGSSKKASVYVRSTVVAQTNDTRLCSKSRHVDWSPQLENTIHPSASTTPSLNSSSQVSLSPTKPILKSRRNTNKEMESYRMSICDDVEVIDFIKQLHKKDAERAKLGTLLTDLRAHQIDTYYSRAVNGHSRVNF